MSNPTDDQINDRIQNDELDLLQEYMESDKGIKLFTDFLWNNSNDEVRNKLLLMFAEAVEGKHYRDWAWDVTKDRMSNREPDND